jgi:hypothetical protein
MGMKRVVFGFILLMVALVGCSNEKQQESAENEPIPEMIEVSIEAPITVNLNEEIYIKATVTQGSDKVDDANEVKFELQKTGGEVHEKIEAVNEGEGVYSIKKTFTENGIYTVIAHVTARSMHSMPRVEITAGNPEEAATNENDTNTGANEDSGHEHDHGHGHQETGLTIGFNQSESYPVNQEFKLETTLTKENSPLLGARVRFEVIPEDESKKQWLDGIEDGEGKYSAPITFTEKGSYHIQIHVNKDKLHEHKIVMIHVN